MLDCSGCGELEMSVDPARRTSVLTSFSGIQVNNCVIQIHICKRNSGGGDWVSTRLITFPVWANTRRVRRVRRAPARVAGNLIHPPKILALNTISCHPRFSLSICSL
jgi:hypothetical protein